MMGSVDMVREKFPAARVLANRENRGFARANNLALTGAQGRYLLLMNPDTIVQEDTFRVMLEFFRAHPETGLAGCKILNPDGSFPTSVQKGACPHLGGIHKRGSALVRSFRTRACLAAII